MLSSVNGTGNIYVDKNYINRDHKWFRVKFKAMYKCRKDDSFFRTLDFTTKVANISI